MPSGLVQRRPGQASSASISPFRLPSRRAARAARKLGGIASAATAAAWLMDEAQAVVWDWMAAIAPTSRAGPPAKPTRHPIIGCDLASRIR